MAKLQRTTKQVWNIIMYIYSITNIKNNKKYVGMTHKNKKQQYIDFKILYYITNIEES